MNLLFYKKSLNVGYVTLCYSYCSFETILINPLYYMYDTLYHCRIKISQFMICHVYIMVRCLLDVHEECPHIIIDGP